MASRGYTSKRSQRRKVPSGTERTTQEILTAREQAQIKRELEGPSQRDLGRERANEVKREKEELNKLKRGLSTTDTMLLNNPTRILRFLRESILKMKGDEIAMCDFDGDQDLRIVANLGRLYFGRLLVDLNFLNDVPDYIERFDAHETAILSSLHTQQDPASNRGPCVQRMKMLELAYRQTQITYQEMVSNMSESTFRSFRISECNHLLQNSLVSLTPDQLQTIQTELDEVMGMIAEADRLEKEAAEKQRLIYLEQEQQRVREAAAAAEEKAKTKEEKLKAKEEEQRSRMESYYADPDSFWNTPAPSKSRSSRRSK